MSEFPASSEDSTSTSDPPTPPPKRQKASTSTRKHKGAHTHKVKEGEGEGKKRREPSPSSASSGSDSNPPDHHHKSTKECVKKQKIHSKETKPSRETALSSQEGSRRSHLDIFQHHYSELVQYIKPCLNTVADGLFSRMLIPDELQSQVLAGREIDQKMASKVLFSIKGRIKSDPAVLLEFIDVLKEEPSCDGITKKITSKYRIFGLGGANLQCVLWTILNLTCCPGT